MTTAPGRSNAECDAGHVTPWPRPIPARIKPAGHDELFVMTLGSVETPLADGVFDPVRDRLTLKDGTVIEDYYRQRLGIAFYEPIDKTVFRLPPSGWCSWYYYYQEVTPEEILANARWIAEHLKDYGARYVQIDDGWQGVGRGRGENRDWTAVDERFRSLGMDRLAAEIHQLGLQAGIWLCPHGQSNAEVAQASGAFLLKPDGTSASDTWVGTYLLDPSVPACHAYLRDLFATLRRWGYTYFKIDGQPIVLDEYAKTNELMEGSFDDRRSRAAQVTQYYRDTLHTIRGAIGPDAYLLGCWGIPLPGVGILNGSRTADDVIQGWDGFLIANDAVQRWNFLHNIAWYCDPDVCMVRPPLSDGTARAWATLQGLTGQALLTSDRLPDLPLSRVNLLKRVYPAVDIRPLDLFQAEDTRKPIWLLKVGHSLPAASPPWRSVDDRYRAVGRDYDVAGVFNYDSERTRTFHLPWSELGLDAKRQYHVFDFWQQMYLGAWEAGIFVEVPPADVRVLAIVPAEDYPVLVTTNRHVSQGWVDLRALSLGRVDDAWVLEGLSRVIADDLYVLTVGLPRAAPTHELIDAHVDSDGSGTVDIRLRSHQGYATATIQCTATQDVHWELTFEPAQPYTYPVQAPTNVIAAPRGPTEADVSWTPEYFPNAGYQVLLDGRPLGVAFRPRVVLRHLEPGRSYVIGVRSVWYDGTTSPTAAEIHYRPATLG